MIRGHRVLLDRDLAQLYAVETRALNQAVQRNRDRFPSDFVFSLTRDEIMNISQSVISFSKLKFSKHVFAFTEQGVAMLSSVLRGRRAAHVNVAIMRVFVKFRETLNLHKDLAHKFGELERKIENHDESIQSLFQAIRQLMAPPEKPKRPMGFQVEEREAIYGRSGHNGRKGKGK